MSWRSNSSGSDTLDITVKDEERERPDGPPFLSLATHVNKRPGVSAKTEGGGAAQAARSKKPSSRKKAGAKPEDKNVSKPVRVRNFKGHTKKQLSESFSKIVEAHLEEAKNGSLKHTDWLFEVGGVKQEIRDGKKGKDRDPSLASLLLLELEKQQSTGEGDGLIEGPEKADPSLPSSREKRASGAAVRSE